MSTKTAPRIALVFAALAVAFAASTAGAAIIVQDNLSYPNGNLVGQGTPPVWNAHSGAGAKAIQVTDGAAVLQQSGGSGEDIHKRWVTPLANNVTTYAGFTVLVKGGSVIGTGSEYFVNFRPAPTDTNGFVGRTYVTPAVGGDGFTLGISATSTGTSPVVPWPTALVFNRSYKVVIAYDAVTGTSTLWVDPSSQASPSVSSTAASVIGKPLESFALRQASPSGATLIEVVDNIVVADSFDEALPSQLVPSLSQWGIMMLMGLLLLGGTVFAIRRRAVA